MNKFIYLFIYFCLIVNHNYIMSHNKPILTIVYEGITRKYCLHWPTAKVLTEVNLQTKEQLPEFQSFRYAVFYFYLYFYFSKQKNIKMYHNNLRNK